jgi:hypothetical protein
MKDEGIGEKGEGRREKGFERVRVVPLVRTGRTFY